MKSLLFTLAFASIAFQHSSAQIAKPDDAPKPLSPAESALRFQVPSGYRVELVASEPLIREPSGVCWDEQGRLFVCELHGYNLEGEYDIAELNQTGQLDRVVRRLQAADKHKQAADQETYGTIKLLRDLDGDGKMDEAQVFADRLPPCLGICPARGGIIAACHTKILFIADRDGDGRADLREVLFEGFRKAPLERSVNSPRWGPDHWIYFGSSAGGGMIRGKYLKQPIAIPNTDFRIRADGSAIEPVIGRTHTMGFTFTESGDRFVISTGTPGIFVAPLSWRYLARNPNIVTPGLEQSAASDSRTWPTSQPHPWRTRRAEDPGFAKFYTDRYGIRETAPNGYFTSACSPLVYRDTALPGLTDQLLACEPAQNLVHRAEIERTGVELHLQRPTGEEESEFLTSSDPWFHAISLAHAPDGTIYIVDFYREIIEDYSAIPRYLQQEYGLVAGQNHGRIWRLTHDDASPDNRSADISGRNPIELAVELASPRFWRRQTARRLLVEQSNQPGWSDRQARPVIAELTAHIESNDTATTLNALSTLDEIGGLQPDHLITAIEHDQPAVRRRALRLAEPWFDRLPADHPLIGHVLSCASDDSPMVQLQLALSLGEWQDERATETLLRLAQQRGDQRWMDTAILTSVSQRAGKLLAKLLSTPDQVGAAMTLIEPLCTAIASRRDRDELSQSLVAIAKVDSARIQASCMRGVRRSVSEPRRVELTRLGREAIKLMAHSRHASVRKVSVPLIKLMKIESPAEGRARLDRATKDLGDVQLSTDRRLAAILELADADDEASTQTLLAALPNGTPRMRAAILAEILGRKQRLPMLLAAIESKSVPAVLLSSVQRAMLLDTDDAELRQRAARLLDPPRADSPHLTRYIAALANPRDIARGEQVFRETCGKCHRAHGVGHTVGPDLNAEFMRSEETIVRDVLLPNEKITAGFGTYAIITHSGKIITGVLASESPTSIALLQIEGKQEVVLRKDVDQLQAMSVSLMPEEIEKTVAPQDLADALAWLRRPPNRLVLMDENRDLIESLDEGSGTAEFISSDRHRGSTCLRVTPLQRYSPRIRDWQFRIRENPGPGEYRYLRFAWKTIDGDGVMIELADDGRWPPAGEPRRRYHAGRNTTDWGSVEVSATAPREWAVVTRDLWKDFGDFTLTGIAPTAMGGAALFDQIELATAK